MATLSKPIQDVYQGNPVSATYKPVASEATTLHTEIYSRTVNDTPIVVLCLGTSNMVGIGAQTTGDHTVLDLVYTWDINMNPATVVAGTQWITPVFGSKPLNIGSTPYANSFPLHFANQLRRRYDRPVYFIMVGKPSTVVEAWIKPATLATNGWSTGGAQDMTALMYPGLANALALVPGAPTTFDYVLLSHGAANDTELPEIVAKKQLAMLADLGSLIDINTTPIIQHEQCHSSGAAYRARHLSMLRGLQEYVPTLRIVRTFGLPPHTAGNVHFSGQAIEVLGKRFEADAHKPPENVDYRFAPLEYGPDAGLRWYTNSTYKASFDIADRIPHVAANPIITVNDASLGWCYETTANAISILWRRQISKIPANGLATVAIEALSPDAASTVDITLSIHCWDEDGVDLGDVDVTPSNSPFTDAMGAALVSATFGVAGVPADGLIPAAAEYISFGVAMGVGGNDERLRFNVRQMDVVSAKIDTVNTLTAGTLALAFGLKPNRQVTPNATATFTSGTTSYTMTFGTGFKTTGTLATGTVTAKTFVLNFISDGTSLIETSRTTAM